ncbi:MAG: hypothetical protein ACETVQ_00995 [Candidatus Bathyarchaeia archaeon]
MMSKNFSQRFYLPFLVSVSLFGLLLVTLPAVSPLPVQEDFQWRKPLIGSVFGLICFLGIIAVFFPGHCSTTFRSDNTENRNHAVLVEGNTALHKTSTIFGLKVTHGHHPSCEGFTAHEFQIGKKTFCTACMGLLLGALITLFGVAAYFFRGWNIGQNISLLLISGVLSVGLGLSQYMFFDIRWRLIRFLLNAFFIFGTFLVLAGIDAVANSSVLDFFVIFLCVFWLFTRILLSKNIHDKICQTCSLKCDGYKK